MNTDKMMGASEALQQKKQFDSLRETINQQRSEILGSMTDELDVDAILAKYTEEEVESMSYAQIKEVFVGKNGNFIFDEEAFPQPMIIDFIKYLKQSQETFVKMDAEMEKLDASLEQFNSEIKEIVGGETSFHKTMKTAIEKDLEKEGCTDAFKLRCEKVLGGLDDAVTLRPLFELYEKVSVKNTLDEFKIESKRIAVLKGYVRVCKDFSLEPKLLKFGGFEKSVLEDEKYHVHNSLIIFIIARYIKYLGKQANEMQNRTFIIQLTNFLRELILGEGNAHYDADKEELQTLKQNIMQLLDKFYN